MNSKVSITLLTLLVLYLASAQGASLRCQCIQIEGNFIHPKDIHELQIIPRGFHCPQMEIIVTLQSSQKVCLNPHLDWVKWIVDKFVNESKKPDVDQSGEA